MSTLLQADIFFFISSIAVIVITVAIGIAVYVIIKMVQEVRTLVRIVQSEVEAFSFKRQRMMLKARFAGKWLRIFTSKLF